MQKTIVKLLEMENFFSIITRFLSLCMAIARPAFSYFFMFRPKAEKPNYSIKAELPQPIYAFSAMYYCRAVVLNRGAAAH
jgi:hypothetical protein